MHSTPSSTAPAAAHLPELRLRIVPSDPHAEPSLVSVSGMCRSSTMAELAAAAGVPTQLADRAVLVDGNAVALQSTVCTAGLRDGSVLAAAPAPGALRPVAVALATWARGPDAARRVELTAGTHFIGRASTAAIAAAGPGLELHHAAVHVGGDGQIAVEQLTGARGLTILRRGVSAAAEGLVHVSSGDLVEIGAHGVEFALPTPHGRAPGTVDRSGPDPWHERWWRVATTGERRAAGMEGGRAVAPPETPNDVPPPAAPLLPALLGVVAASALALVLRQPMLLAFGVLGAVVAAGSWAGQQWTAHRRRRRRHAEDRRAVDAALEIVASRCDAHAEALRTGVMTIARAASTIECRADDLWSVRPGDPDAFRVCLGDGEITWLPPLEGWSERPELWPRLDACAQLGRGPIITSLGPGARVALVGMPAANVARSLVVQLAAAMGPADWRLEIVTHDPSLWSELRWLPHCSAGAGTDDGRVVVRVIEATMRTSGTVPTAGCAELVVCAGQAEVPRDATAVLLIAPSGEARWVADPSASSLPLDVAIAGVGAQRAGELAASLAALTDPLAVDELGELPQDVRIGDVLGLPVGADDLDEAVRRCWAARRADASLVVPLGVAAGEVFAVDLVGDGPHTLIAGTTGAGKSELLRTLVVGLAARHGPDLVNFVLVDYKGGAAFDACAQLPHTVGLVTDLDGDLADRATVSLDAELRRREHLLRAAGADDLGHYARRRHDAHHLAALPRLVVVIDEFATVASTRPEFIAGMLDIARRGRSLGVHLVFATQRPHGVVSDDMRANTALRIALRVHDAADSVDVVGDPRACRLRPDVPGRAVVRSAGGLVDVQVACCGLPPHRRAQGITARPIAAPDARPDDDGALRSGSDLDLLVRAISGAARRSGTPPPHRPWLEPLSVDMELPATGAAVGVGVVGVVDDPAQQSRHALAWCPADGHLLLVGGARSGRTTTLEQIAAALRAASRRQEIEGEIVAIDAGRCGAMEWPDVDVVVARSERERMTRVLTHLAEARRDRSRPHVLLVDGLDLLRTQLEGEQDWECLDLLDRVIATGAVNGVAVVASVTRPGAVPLRLSAAMPRRWIFALDDPLDAALLGVRADCVPRPIPGRCFDTASGCHAQVLVRARDSAGRAESPAQRSRLGAIAGVLPRRVAGAALPDVTAEGDGLAIGIGFRNLAPVSLPLHAGEHVLVIGPGRTGRTSALSMLAARWCRAHPDGWVGSLAPRRTSARPGVVCATLGELLAEAEATGGARLLVIDDAELVADPAGALAALLERRDESLTVFAAGRGDNLRSAYGHWTAVVRRSRLGLVFAAAGDLDGDLLGTVLPRRCPIEPRPGLAWLIADGRHDLVQLAGEDTEDALSSTDVCLGS